MVATIQELETLETLGTQNTTSTSQPEAKLTPQQLTVDAQELTQVLKTLKPLMTSAKHKSSLLESSCVYIAKAEDSKVAQVHVNKWDIAVVSKLQTESTGSFECAVEYKSLSVVLPDKGKITISHDGVTPGSTTYLQHDGGRIKLQSVADPSRSSGWFISVPELAETPEINEYSSPISKGVLAYAERNISPLAITDDSRPILTMLYVELCAAGELRLTAADGYQLGHMLVAHGHQAKRAWSGLIHTHALRLAVNAGASEIARGGQSAGGYWIRLSNQDKQICIYSLDLHDKYVDYERVMPSKEAKLSMCVDTGSLKLAANQLVKFSEPPHTTQLRHEPGSNRLKLSVMQDNEVAMATDLDVHDVRHGEREADVELNAKYIGSLIAKVNPKAKVWITTGDYQTAVRFDIEGDEGIEHTCVLMPMYKPARNR